MTPLSDALTAAQGWYARLQNAELSEDEFQRWQRLVDDKLSAETALAIVLRARQSPPNGKEA